MKKIQIILLLILFLSPLGFTQAKAISPTPAVSVTPQITPTEEPSATSSQEKAKQILEAVKERVKERKLSLSRRAYVGTLKSIADTTLVLETKQGIRQVQLSAEAAIIQIGAGGKKTIKFEDLPIGEKMIAMGFLDENEVLEARRIIITMLPEPVKRKAVYGLVQEVDLKGKTLTLQKPKKGESWTIEISDKTIMHKDVKLSEIKQGDRLVAIGILDPEDPLRLSARKIVLLPLVPKPTTETSPTPSVELSPTPKAKPSPTKAVSPTPTLESE